MSILILLAEIICDKFLAVMSTTLHSTIKGILFSH